MSGVCITAVIFDLDGTLIDSLPGIEFSLKEAFADCGRIYPHVDLRELIGPPIRTILSQLANTAGPEVLVDLENGFRISYDIKGWRMSSCYPGTTPALQALHDAGLRLFVVTNKPRHIATRCLEIMNLDPFFERIITRDSRVPPYADKEEMIDSLVTSCALAIEKCVLVGDTEEDGRAAAHCGVRFAHVSHGYGSVGEDSPTPVHLKLNGISQLLQWIGLELAHDR